VQRNRHHGVEALVSRQRLQQQRTQRPRQRPDPAVFVEVNQIAKSRLVRAERVGRIKTAKAAAAQSAAAFWIQRKTILEWCAATYTEVLGAKRFRRFQAGVADRNTADFEERGAANTAVIGEEEGKKGVGSCSNC
jgi:hypothetical protein